RLDTKAEVYSDIAGLAVKDVMFYEGESIEQSADLDKWLGTVFPYLDKEDKIREEETFKEIEHEVRDETILPVLKLLLNYLAKTQMRSLDHLQLAEQYDTSHYLVFTQEVRRNLELTTSLRDGSRNGTLLWVL